VRNRLALALGIALSVWALSIGTTAAQEAVSVTVAVARQGVIRFGCQPPSPEVSTPAEFALTRTGDVTDSLTVSIAWSGDITLGTTVSPTSVTFAAGSSTAVVTPMFTSVPLSPGLTLTVASGAGYQPGDPSAATTEFAIVTPGCIAQTPPLNAPPPVQVEPSFTG
jgi:hypothetical protein